MNAATSVRDQLIPDPMTSPAGTRPPIGGVGAAFLQPPVEMSQVYFLFLTKFLFAGLGLIKMINFRKGDERFFCPNPHPQTRHFINRRFLKIEYVF